MAGGQVWATVPLGRVTSALDMSTHWWMKLTGPDTYTVLAGARSRSRATLQLTG